jgi:hypothetical protein
MKRTPDEILLFLVRNSKPEYHEYPVSDRTSCNDPRCSPRTRREKLNALLLCCSGTTRYKCPVPALEAFLGETLSFEKHLRALADEGTLWFNEQWVHDPETTKADRAIHDAVGGQVKDYETGQSWVAFHYRENEFLSHSYAIEKDADALGLYKR